MYGIEYNGNRTNICEKIINILPQAENFYDIFCGGMSLTDCAIQSNKYTNFYANDINKPLMDAIQEAIDGTLDTNLQWVSPQDFKDSYFFSQESRYVFSQDTIVLNKCKYQYLYYNDNTTLQNIFHINNIPPLPTIEERYNAMLEALQKQLNPIFNKTDITSHYYKKLVYDFIPYKRLQSLLTFTNKIDSNTNLFLYNGDYQHIIIKENSVTIIDAPYHIQYTNKINWQQLIQWIQKQPSEIFIIRGVNDLNFMDNKFEAVEELPQTIVMANGTTIQWMDKLYYYNNK